MREPVKIMTVASCSNVRDEHRGHVVVSGSYGGRYNAYNAAKWPARAVIMNDAGIGKDDAGIVGLPFLALLAAVPLAWGWGLGWHDIVLGGIFYTVSGLGVTVGFHRYFTHRSFKAVQSVHIALAVAGSLAMEGPVLTWVANHRRQHKYSDRDGDPHSPWRFGTDWKALAKGLTYAHMGWYFDRNQTSRQRFCPDLLADRGIRRVSQAFPLLTAASLLLPPLAGGLWSMSWKGALTAFFWASLVRIALLQHATWSINSLPWEFATT